MCSENSQQRGVSWDCQPGTAVSASDKDGKPRGVAKAVWQGTLEASCPPSLQIDRLAPHLLFSLILRCPEGSCPNINQSGLLLTVLYINWVSTLKKIIYINALKRLTFTTSYYQMPFSSVLACSKCRWKCLHFYSLFIFSSRSWTESLEHARQVLYHWATHLPRSVIVVVAV